MKKKSNLTLFMKQLIRSLKEEERLSLIHISVPPYLSGDTLHPAGGVPDYHDC